MTVPASPLALDVRRAALPAADCARWVARVYEARAAWTHDFGGEQYSLGRAFYTHLETERARQYFAGAGESDARVEAALPGMQRWMRELAASIVGGEVRPRRAWCGPGVHVFPAGGHVARTGGVIHFDTEGLAPGHLARRSRAVTVVLMLEPPEEGGGLRLWDVRYSDRDALDERELAAASEVVVSGPGDAVAIDSYRAHQIRPFGGTRDRVSATVHLAEVDDGVWDSWF